MTNNQKLNSKAMTQVWIHMGGNQKKQRECN